MANRKRDAGREALEKKGWWRSHRWLVLRRLCQFFVLGMFLSGPWLQSVDITAGNQCLLVVSVGDFPRAFRRAGIGTRVCV